jgi:hypothetical protein
MMGGRGQDPRAQQPAANPNAVITTIKRIEQLISEENAALGSRQAVGFKVFSDRKDQALLELQCALSSLRPGNVGGDIAKALTSLVAQLERNKRLLEIHHEAVKDLANVFAASASEMMSDGTYSSRRPHVGRRP